MQETAVERDETAGGASDSEVPAKEGGEPASGGGAAAAALLPEKAAQGTATVGCLTPDLASPQLTLCFPIVADAPPMRQGQEPSRAAEYGQAMVETTVTRFHRPLCPSGHMVAV